MEEIEDVTIMEAMTSWFILTEQVYVLSVAPDDANNNT